MTQFLRHRWRSVVLAASGAVIGLGGAFWLSVRDQESAESITVRDGSLTVVQGGLDEALEEASRRAGFEVVAPRDAPAGMHVTDILVHPAPQLPPGAPPSNFRLVTLRLEVRGAIFLLDQLRNTFDPALSGEELAGAVSDGRVWFDETDTAVIYSMNSRGRGVVLSAIKPAPLDRDTALAVLDAFSRELP